MGPLTEEVFIRRTLEIIEQYRESKNREKEEYYNITLLFNCLLGLLVLPRQKLSYSSADRDLPDVLKGTVASAEDKQGTPFPLKFVEYVIGLRNAVSHLSIDGASPFITNGQNTISCIKLSGETTPEVNGKKVKHCIEYEFGVIAENQLEQVINDILTFIYPCQFKAKNSSVKS